MNDNGNVGSFVVFGKNSFTCGWLNKYKDPPNAVGLYNLNKDPLRLVGLFTTSISLCLEFSS